MRQPLRRQFIDNLVSGEWPLGCVIGLGAPHPNGYARVTIDKHTVRAHIYACEQAHGIRPAGLTEVAHSCGVKRCVNPRHLRWATHAENERDKVAHGKTNRGERSAAAKLSAVQVREIRSTYSETRCSQVSLAKEYGVSIMTINDIVRNRTWIEPF